MKLKANLGVGFLVCAAIPLFSAAPLSAQELSASEQAARCPSTITIDVRRNQRLSMFLFAYHAARSLSERELEERIELTAADTAALREHAEAFAPLAAAFEPYLDHHPLRSRDMLFMSGNLTGAEVDFPDPAMMEALLAFEPTYSAEFAPRHQAATGSMADALQAQLATQGDKMARAVAALVEGQWRENDPIRLELVPYVSRAGAYTISYHTVMSSLRADYRDHALEMAFHEAAHTKPMTDRIREVANSALAKHGVKNRRFWHYLQFYAIGRAAQSVLGEDYLPYHEANGLDQRGGAKAYYAAIDAVWDEHDNLADRADAAIALIAAQQSD